MIWRDQRRGAVAFIVFFFGIDDADNLTAARSGSHPLQKLAVDRALAVIGNDDCVEIRRVRDDEFTQPFQRAFTNGLAVLAIQADDLLVVRAGDDPAFFYGLEARVDDDARRGCADFPKRRDHSLAGLILADDPTSRDLPAQASNIMNDVRRSAEAGFFRGDPQHRDRRLRREPLDLAPNESVKHKIADHEQPERGEFFENRCELRHNERKSPIRQARSRSRSSKIHFAAPYFAMKSVAGRAPGPDVPSPAQASATEQVWQSRRPRRSHPAAGLKSR